MSRNTPGSTAGSSYMYMRLPRLELDAAAHTGVSGSSHKPSIPDELACRALWEQYGVLPHIGDHSARVAELALALAERAVELGKRDVRALTLAAGLLHDIAKSYTIRYGGSHAQLGASWVMTHTRNPVIAQAVMLHVWWPWNFPADMACPALFVLYADKRVMHDSLVDLDTRYTDLLSRYGKTEASRQAIIAGHEHGHTLQCALSAYLEMPLDACTVTGGRLVERA